MSDMSADLRSTAIPGHPAVSNPMTKFRQSVWSAAHVSKNPLNKCARRGRSRAPLLVRDGVKVTPARVHGSRLVCTGLLPLS